MTHLRRSVVRSLQHLHYIWALGFHSFPAVVQLFWHSMALLSFLLVSQVWVFGISGWDGEGKVCNVFCFIFRCTVVHLCSRHTETPGKLLCSFTYLGRPRSGRFHYICIALASVNTAILICLLLD
ncbi:hypothetical protein BDV30DRAFT_123127 [Aspergillus minisclerotigenes]|uniref:Uncharacterized protein n=1 Tax=Aspergillus minisclerotigenes TaxID=656917 RepID=A0A5N6JLI7_9EURO|nr:hypothetical protein BDV30DRAFT_123127 [Aspergillus minisclerotigenes]